MIDFEKVIYEAFKGENIVEYTSDLVNKVPEEFRRNVDEQLIMRMGVDSNICWAMGGKIFIEKTSTDDGDFVFRIVGSAIPPGYNEKAHLYSINSRVYVEDDYAWMPLPKISDAKSSAHVAYSSSEISNEDEDTGDSYMASNYVAKSDGADENGFFLLNFQEENWSIDNMMKLEPLIVEHFDLDNPIMKLEIAYRNALCEIESYPACGWIVLMHNGHFYVPVESVEDPINHEIYYYYKVFNSYPTGITSTYIYSIATLELFGTSFELAIRYRPGYSINWKKYFRDQILPDDYEEQIPDLYSLTDKPFGLTEEKNMDYDGIERDLHEDDIDGDNNEEGDATI